MNYGRFIATITQKRFTSKTTGYMYPKADSFIVPTTREERVELAEAFKDRTYCLMCDAVNRRHKERIAEIMSKSV